MLGMDIEAATSSLLTDTGATDTGATADDDDAAALLEEQGAVEEEEEEEEEEDATVAGGTGADRDTGGGTKSSLSIQRIGFSGRE